jgi:integrase/recombinase XerD
MHAKFEEFLRERQYLLNVSPKTLDNYTGAFVWLNVENPTQADVTDMVVRMREAGNAATSVNNRLRCVQAYMRWLTGTDVKLKKLKEPQRVPQVFSQSDIAKIAAYKPRLDGQHRLQVLLLLLADTGVRIGEALGLQWADIDMDNLLLTVVGKGDKQRRVPFSYELRKYLWRYKQRKNTHWVFESRVGTPLIDHDVYMDTKLLCTRLGIKAPERLLHAFRHSFATNYVRMGGSVFGLQRALGHSSILMSQRYTHLNTADLSAVHERITLLKRK